jgi:hypothetical protein
MFQIDVYRFLSERPVNDGKNARMVPAMLRRVPAPLMGVFLAVYRSYVRRIVV